ncbi:hypothetical protein DKW60_03885 [Leucothrix pacifica]|uniref:Uncharacterized protein n=1 Tax=Leucothrix pacifica TaxID=1247513 RepID=A0A317CMU0_9GAMM|nr:hypothetical protein DKW60_03885 [Leucothrix pacifica]
MSHKIFDKKCQNKSFSYRKVSVQYSDIKLISGASASVFSVMLTTKIHRAIIVDNKKNGHRMLNHIPTLFSRISRSIQFLSLVGLTLLLMASSAFAQYEVTVINQASSSASGVGASGIPSLTVNVPEGNNRAVFIISHFEREHCSVADDTAAGCYVDSPLLSDNFANNVIDDNQTNMIISGAGGSLNKTNPFVFPDGDLRFLRMIRNYMGSTGSNGAFISRESYHFAIYESEIEFLLGSVDVLPKP